MFDIGGVELLVVAAIAILVVGPRELPGMLRSIGGFVRQAKQMTSSVQRQFNDALKEAELDDVKKTFDDVRSLNPATQVRKAISKEMKPFTEVGDSLKSSVDEAASIGKVSTDAAKTKAASKPAAAATAGAAATTAPTKAEATVKKPAKAASDGTVASKPKPKAKPATKAPAKPKAKTTKPKAETSAAKPRASTLTQSKPRQPKAPAPAPDAAPTSPSTGEAE